MSSSSRIFRQIEESPRVAMRRVGGGGGGGEKGGRQAGRKENENETIGLEQ